MAQKRSLLSTMPTVSTSEEDESPSEDEKHEQESKIKPKSKPESDSDDEGEEEEEEEEEEESEDEEEIEKAVPVKDKKPSVHKHSTVAVPATPTKKLQSSSETDADDASGSESDSGNTQQSPTASAFTIKPISSKPVAASSVSKKPASKSTSQVSSTPVKPTGKRLAETPQNGKDSKKSKVSEEDGKTEEKKSAITRVWSDKDEIAILDGMIRYKSEKGSDPSTDMMAFKEFLKDSIRSDVSKSQLSEKIRRLKKKYLTNAEKGENGEDPALLKPHDYRIFELSKKIWGSSSTVTNVGENNGTSGTNGTSSAKKIKKIEQKEDSKSTVTVAELPKAERVKEVDVMGDEKVGKDLCSVYPRLNQMFNIEGYLAEDTKRFLKESINLIGSSKAKEMDEKWKKLQIEEFEVYSKRVTLIDEQNKLVLDALKSSKN